MLCGAISINMLNERNLPLPPDFTSTGTSFLLYIEYVIDFRTGRGLLPDRRLNHVVCSSGWPAAPDQRCILSSFHDIRYFKSVVPRILCCARRKAQLIWNSD